nr:hypothetical protein CFP56_62599 [Quercus suber]
MPSQKKSRRFTSTLATLQLAIATLQTPAPATFNSRSRHFCTDRRRSALTGDASTLTGDIQLSIVMFSSRSRCFNSIRVGLALDRWRRFILRNTSL